MEHKLKYLALATVLFSISLSGCAITVSDLKNSESSLDGSFISKTGSSDTYRTLRHIARQCLEYESYSGNPVIVFSEFDGERKEGEITQKLVSEGLLINNTLIEIESHDGDKAKISLYTTKNILSTGIRSPNISDIKRWTDGDRAC
ncbi:MULTISPECIES: hypothetical protein [Erwinia]|uniref:Lipoprotein n=1 Tax=Erwinia rhapontici TaxID=55212 RepID=A0ABM7N293_ERWRD|nr:hypothetical protein [Erwinia rhapontici]BCQ35547.1 hypothetical protein ERHA53_28900 [Erwinia rhapontici]BCQ40447.1 hypothetical protein ERHA54_30500 [Erwinia rhapontici]BCQ45722.1 hypothetical protein ERHA55_32490 [Erwinia rhapontici]